MSDQDRVNDLENTVIALCKLWTDMDEAWMKAISSRCEEKATDYLTENMPIVQTSAMQFLMKRVGERDYDKAGVATTIGTLDPREKKS